jgi:hypothetical protein
VPWRSNRSCRARGETLRASLSAPVPCGSCDASSSSPSSSPGSRHIGSMARFTGLRRGGALRWESRTQRSRDRLPAIFGARCAQPADVFVRDPLARRLSLGDRSEAEDAPRVRPGSDPPVSRTLARESLEALAGRDNNGRGGHFRDRSKTLDCQVYSSCRSNRRRSASASCQSSGREVLFFNS